MEATDLRYSISNFDLSRTATFFHKSQINIGQIKSVQIELRSNSENWFCEWISIRDMSSSGQESFFSF